MRVTEKLNYFGSLATLHFDEPSSCPLCKYGIKPQLLDSSAFKNEKNEYFIVITYLCKACHNPFFTLHTCSHSSGKLNSDINLVRVEPIRFTPRVFEERISDVSPGFVKIYNQAIQAETQGLDEIAGMGLRKALEFLIKDYLFKMYPGEDETIKKMELGNCIANKVTNVKLKAVASRSAWIGNDFTHYQRRFEDKDITDLHAFIDATLYWITAELITDEALQMVSQGRA